MQQPFNELSAFLQSLPEPHILFDREYRIISVNPAFRKYCNSHDAIIGKTCYAVSHGYERPCDHSGETCPLKKSLESGKAERVLHMHHTPEGEEYVSIVLTPIKNHQKEIIGFVEKIDPLKTIKSPKAYQLQGKSPAFLEMMDTLKKAASSDITVLLEGETGVGKRTAAQFIHQTGWRCASPFITIDCPTLTEEEFTRIFLPPAHETNRKKLQSKITVANAIRSTIFLNEVAGLTSSLQARLLHFLDSDIAHQSESVINQKNDIRIIASSQHNLGENVAKGLFRKDLYYRLDILPITIPALRRRQEDILLLAQQYLKTFSIIHERTLSSGAMLALQGYDFPGNIRELRNIIERACLLANTPEITENDLRIPGKTGDVPDMNNMAAGEQDNNLLKYCHINRKALAKHLGISERTLYRKLAQLKDS